MCLEHVSDHLRSLSCTVTTAPLDLDAIFGLFGYQTSPAPAPTPEPTLTFDAILTRMADGVAPLAPKLTSLQITYESGYGSQASSFDHDLLASVVRARHGNLQKVRVFTPEKPEDAVVEAMSLEGVDLSWSHRENQHEWDPWGSEEDSSDSDSEAEM